ncbi:MAG: sialidase family protein [Candidatus Limnocylindrales bacterium]
MAARVWHARSARMVACAAVLAVTGLPSAVAQSPSATPYDVSLFKWAKTDDAEGFDQRPLLNELVVSVNGRVLLLGAVGTEAGPTPVVWGSDDGRTWSQLEGDLPDGTVAFDGVAAGDGFLVITTRGDGDAGQLFRSDGTRLEPVVQPGDDLIAIERSPVGVHMLDSGGLPTLWSSTDDAATWTPGIITTDDALARHLAVTDDGTIVVVGVVRGEDRETPTAWSSADGGATWHATTLPVEAGRWVIGDLGWTPIGMLTRVIDATQPDGPGVNMLSPDGITWESTVETTGWGSVGSAGPEAIIFGTDAAWHSPDGVTWTEEWWPTLAGFDIVASRQMPGGPVVAAGIQTAAPGSSATFVGAPAPQVVPTAPIDLTSPAP